MNKKAVWYKDKYAYISFGLCFAIAFLSFGYFILEGNGVFTLMTDFRAQQIPFSIGLNDAVKNRDFGWQWNVDLGTNMIGAYSFYNLGSPFFWVSLLFPAEWFPYLVGWLYILKYAVAGMTAYYYIERFTVKKGSAVFGAVLYAFSGFQTINLLFYHFHEVVAFFPLLLLGLEKLVIDRKKGLFALAVFLNCILNYYFFAGEVIFLVLYYICRFGLKKERITGILQCCLEGLMGIGMAAFLFLPSIIFIQGNPDAGSSIIGSGAWLYDLKGYLEIIGGILFPAEPMYQQSAIMRENFSSTSAYIPAVGLALSLAYFIRKGGWIRKISGMCLIISLCPMVNSIFYAFSQDYRRWWYMPVLILALASAIVMDSKEQYNIRVGAGILLGTELLYGTILLWQIQAGKIELYSLKMLLMTVGMAVICTIAVLVSSGADRLFVRVAWGLVVGVAVITTSWMILQLRINAETPQELAVKWEGDRQLYNPDINFRYDTDNGGAYIGGVHPLRIYNTTITGSIFEMHQAVGLSRSPAAVNMDVIGIPEWLGGKYYVVSDPDQSACIVDTVRYGDKERYIVEKEACPISFTYDSYIRKTDFDQIEPSLRGGAVLKALVIPDEEENEVSPYLNQLDLTTVNAAALDLIGSDIQRNLEHQVQIYEMNGKGLKASVDTKKETYAFFSVPYDKGWTAYVNGEQAAIMKTSGLMAIPVPAGEVDIELRYATPGWREGVVISFASLFVWLIYLFVSGKKNKGRL